MLTECWWCLSMYANSPQAGAQLSIFQIPQGEVRVLLLQHKTGVHRPLLCVGCSGACWPQGAETHYWSWSCSVSSPCKKSIVSFSAWLLCVFLGTLTATFSGQKNLKSSSGLDGRGVWGSGEIHLYVWLSPFAFHLNYHNILNQLNSNIKKFFLNNKVLPWY